MNKIEKWSINKEYLVSATQDQIENFIHIAKQLPDIELKSIENISQTIRYEIKIIPSKKIVEFTRSSS